MRKIFKLVFISIRAVKCLLSPSIFIKLGKAWAVFRMNGLRACWDLAKYKFSPSRDYYKDATNRLSAGQAEFLQAKFATTPKISIVIPIYKIALQWLEKCITSVVRQYYPNWELILVDDASHQEDITQLMKTWADRDERIRFFKLEQNRGIAGATNFGLEQAQGEYVGFLDHDDELTPDALTWVVWTLQKHPDALWLYSDEDKISENGQRSLPYFKPDYSPEFLLANMYTCHFSVYHNDLLKKAGYLREGFDGAQDHDLALRISEMVTREQVVHIPRILYHWRMLASSTSGDLAIKPQAISAGRRAVAQALQRRNINGRVESYRPVPSVYQIEFTPSTTPKISIIIPSKNAVNLLRKCINSIHAHTQYPNFDIIVIDNASGDPDALAYLNAESAAGKLKVVPYDKPFNHSDMNNIAVAHTDAELILLLNNDIEIISDKWLEQMVGTMELSRDIAAVGALLYYPNRTIQHSGIILGIRGRAGHAHKRLSCEISGYFHRIPSLQEFTAVTAALIMIKQKCFQAIGGFNAQDYPTSYNDVDLCLRLRQKGYRCIYNPMIRAFHHETATRVVLGGKEEVYWSLLEQDHAKLAQNDPFYNPNLSLQNEQFCGYRPFPVTDQIPELLELPED